jgi:predicted GNAT superfamily acetyltransferase
MESQLKIEVPESLDGFEELQQLIWSSSKVDVVPSHLLKAHKQHGACVLGAWLSNELVGVAYAFPAVSVTKESYLYSSLVGVRPGYQGQGIGRQIKLAQASWAKQHGYRRIVWTFDPLQVANAHLNIARLGATSQRYLVNYYGDLDDDLNRGLPTDRLEIDWWLDSSRSLVPEVTAQISFPVQLSLEAKRHWRLKTRVEFQAAFQEGLSVIGFEVKEDQATYRLGSQGIGATAC